MESTNRSLSCITIALLLATIPLACDKEPPATSTRPTADEAPAGMTPADATDNAAREGNELSDGSESAEKSGSLIIKTTNLPADTRLRIEQLQKAHLATPGSTNRIENLGLGYTTIKEYEAAARCFDRAAELIPNNFKFHYVAGLLYRRSTDFGAARRAFERAAKIDPAYVAVHVQLGELALEDDPARARAHFERALELDDTDEIAWWGLGTSAEAQGKMDEAKTCFEKALSIMPNYAAAHYGLSRCYRNKGDTIAAEKALQAYEAGRNPSIDNDPIRFAFRGLTSTDQEIVDVSLEHARSGHPEKAIEVLQGAIRLRRDSVAIRQCLGAIYLDAGDYLKAADEFNVALKSAPDSAELLTLLGICYLEAGQIQFAAPPIEKARSIMPDDVKVLSVYGALCLARGDATASEAAFSRALAKQPDDPALLFRASKASLALGNNAEARKRLTAAVRIAPDHAPSRFSLGMLDMQEGDAESAAKQWESIVSAGAAFPDAYLALAGMAGQKSNYSLELNYLEIGHEKCPDSAALTNALAWALATTPYDELRDADRALRLAMTATNMTPGVNHAILDTLAVAHAATGGFAQAIETMKQAISAAESEGVSADRIEQYRKRITQFENNEPYVRSSS